MIEEELFLGFTSRQ